MALADPNKRPAATSAVFIAIFSYTAQDRLRKSEVQKKLLESHVGPVY
jgi:hypothetical protein